MLQKKYSGKCMSVFLDSYAWFLKNFSIECCWKKPKYQIETIDGMSPENHPSTIFTAYQKFVGVKETSEVTLINIRSLTGFWIFWRKLHAYFMQESFFQNKILAPSFTSCLDVTLSRDPLCVIGNPYNNVILFITVFNFINGIANIT